MKNFCFQLNRKLWVTMAMLLALAIPSLAQSITVTGHVTDETGEDLIGATIMEKGTSNGTSADLEGNFSITVPSNATLVVSYVGYDPMDVPVNGQTHLNIVMKQNATVLAETVVIGYGTVKKQDATGAVAVISPDDVEAGISTSAQDLLVGASPGVVVTTNGGDPTGSATIRIRGGASLNASNDPLIVIDGVPMSNMNNGAGGNPMSNLNPNNIESMTILKDASATAIYGSRASNGVIIITTKKGKNGRPQVNFAANWHVNTPGKLMNMMGTNKLVDFINTYGSDAAKGMLSKLNYNEDPEGEPMYHNTNWQDAVLRTSFSQDYSLSVGGSAGILPYRVNASWTDNNGIMKTSGMQRTTVGFTLTPKFFNDALKITATANGSYVRTRHCNWNLSSAVTMAPVYPIHEDYATTGRTGMTMFNGYYNLTDAGKYATQGFQNPVQELDDVKNIGKSLSSNGSLQIDYSLYWVPELHFNLNLGYEVTKAWQHSRTEENSIMAWRGNDNNGAGTDYKWYQLQRNTMLSFYINYKKQFDAIKSNLDVTVGYDWQRQDAYDHSSTVYTTMGFYNNWTDGSVYNNGVYTLNYDPATAANIGKTYKDAPVNYGGFIYQLLSFYGRLNYTFDDTYLLTFTIRDDGSSRFSKDNRWGLFPAAALAWKINNMSFMEDTRGWLNEFKLRASWGQTGQQDLNGMYFPYMPNYINSYTNGFRYLSPDGSGEWIYPYYPQAYNPDLTWETTSTWDVGLDMGFLNNRITLTLDWYKRNTTDLLANVATAAMNTQTKMWRNIGDMENIGIDATITAKPVVTDNFTWTTSLNIGWNKNKITKLQGEGVSSALQAEGLGDTGNTGLQYFIVGKPAFTYLVYEQVYDKNGDPIEGVFVDQDANGIIDENDKIMYHSRDPKVTMSWNNSFSWKNWDLSIQLRASIGNYVYNSMKYNSTNGYSAKMPAYNLSNLLDDTYIFMNGNTNNKLSNYFVENASFLRCDNITLGYTFQKDWGSLRIFGAVQNPFLITKYSGVDPEVFSGIDKSPYPRPITTTLGVVLNL